MATLIHTHTHTHTHTHIHTHTDYIELSDMPFNYHDQSGEWEGEIHRGTTRN